MFYSFITPVFYNISELVTSTLGYTTNLLNNLRLYQRIVASNLYFFFTELLSECIVIVLYTAFVTLMVKSIITECYYLPYQEIIEMYYIVTNSFIKLLPNLLSLWKAWFYTCSEYIILIGFSLYESVLARVIVLTIIVVSVSYNLANKAVKSFTRH